MAKATTTAKVDETQDQAVTPENIENTENTAPKATTTAKEKVYKFVSDNKYLTCASLGVQFVNGRAETTNLEVAKALATKNGVTLIEE